MVRLQDVYDALESENRYAQKKWSEIQGTPYVNQHEIAAWLLYMQHHLNKAIAIASSSLPETEALHEIRKVTQLGIRAMLNHGAPKREGY